MQLTSMCHLNTQALKSHKPQCMQCSKAMV